MIVDSFTVNSAGPEETQRIASVLAKQLVPGDVVLLKGELASGKTTFVKALAQALESPDLVTSPTFSLVHFYRAGELSVMHVDAYRLSGVHEYRDLGLDEYSEASITVIEWGDKIVEDFPSYLMITFQLVVSRDNERVITFHSPSVRWLTQLSQLHRDMVKENRHLKSIS